VIVVPSVVCFDVDRLLTKLMNSGHSWMLAVLYIPARRCSFWEIFLLSTSKI